MCRLAPCPAPEQGAVLRPSRHGVARGACRGLWVGRRREGQKGPATDKKSSALTGDFPALVLQDPRGGSKVSSGKFLQERV